MANYFTFRVDALPSVTRDSIITFFSNLSVRHLVVHEISDVTKKPHYQGWLYTDLSNQSMQNRIKKAWPEVTSTKRGRSSGHYSCAPVRKDTYKEYCLKGTATELPDVVSMQLAPFEEIDIPDIHAKWWAAREADAPRLTIVQEGIAHFNVQNMSGFYNHDKRRRVAEWLVNRFAGRGVNSYLLKNYINGILCVVDADYKEQYIAQLADTERW